MAPAVGEGGVEGDEPPAGVVYVVVVLAHHHPRRAPMSQDTRCLLSPRQSRTDLEVINDVTSHRKPFMALSYPN